jgi:fibronectin-binding autotransporter adhesin
MRTLRAMATGHAPDRGRPVPNTATHNTRRPAGVRNRRRALTPLCALLAAIGLCHPAGADTWTWTGGASGNWSDPANWAEGLPASAADTALLLDAATRPTSFNDIAGGLVLNQLTLGANAATPTLSGNALLFQGVDPLLQMQTTTGHATIDNALRLGSNLTVQGGGSTATQLFLRGSISGAAGLHLASGRTVLAGNNTYSGATTVAGGATLGVAGGGLAGTSGIAVAAGGELQIVNSNVVTTLNRPITLAGRLSSSARMVNTVFGPVAGATAVGPVTLAGNADVVVLGATGIGLNRSEFVVNGSIDRAGHTLRLATDGLNNSLQVAAIGGAGGLLLQPRGGNIAAGAVTGDGDVVASGAGGNASLASLSGNGLLTVNFDAGSVGQMRISGALAGQRDIDVREGTLTLGTVVPLALTGQITLRGDGVLSLGRESYLGSASPTLQFIGGGRLQLNDNGFNVTRHITTTGGTAALAMGSGSHLVSGTISGDGGFAVSGGLVTLSGDNSFAGGLSVFNGSTSASSGLTNTTVVLFSHDGNLGQAGGAVRLQGALSLPDGYALSRPVELLANTARVSGRGDHVLSSSFTGTGRLNLGGPGRFLLTGNASHSGGVTLAGESNGTPAVLVIDSEARLGAPGGVLNIGRSSGIFVLPGTLEATGHLSIAASRSTSFRNMTVDSAGFDVVFNQAIDGRGMTKAGAGTWTLNTANTDDSGDNQVDVLQGALALGVDQALGTRSKVRVADGAELRLAGRALTVTSLDVATTGVVDLGAGGNLQPLFGTLDGRLQGQGSLLVGRAGFVPGNVSLNNANSFTGSVVVGHGSSLLVGHVHALGDPSNSLRLDNGTLATRSSLDAPLVISDATKLQIGPGGAGFHAEGQSIVITRALTGNAPLRFEGGSLPTSLGGEGGTVDVRLAHRSNSFVGDIVLGNPQRFGAAVLGITADGSLGAAGNRLILGTSVFDGESTRSAEGGLRAWDSLTLAASRTILMDGESGNTAGFIDTNGHTVVVAGGIGALASNLGLLKTGAGTLVLNGVQGYTGLTTVEAGTLGGHGEVERLVLEAATLAPGESAGLFSVRQGLSFQAGTLAMELGGLARGSSYDALDVGGSLDLGFDTVLSLRFIGGFLAHAGQQFQLVDGDTDVVGSFANVTDGARLLTDDGAGSFVVHYGAGQGLRLTDFQATAAVPEPATWGLMALGLLGVGAAAQRRKAGRD